MKIVQFIYNDQEVEFTPSGSNNVMVNATQMAKIFGKDVYQFTRIDDTKQFISSCLKPQNCGLLGIKNEEDLIISKQKSGTWMHRVLALKFAAWLDSDFEVWVFSTIDKILYQEYQNIKQAALKKFELEKKLEDKKEELMEKYPEDFTLYLKINDALKKSDYDRMKAIKDQMQQLRFDFEQNPV